MLANYLIGLREGLEAALVVGILVAYLVRIGRRDLLPHVWAGAATAAGIALAFGAVLTYGPRGLSDRAQEAISGVLSLVAVALITWMIFWMARTARHLAGRLHERLADAIETSPRAVVLMALVAVGREALETTLFLWAGVRSADAAASPLLGAASGLASAALLGYLIYRGSLRVDLRLFFAWTGAFLVVIAAGVLAHGVHDLQEAQLLPGEDALAFDVSGAVPAASWYGTLLKGILSFSPQTTWLQAMAWVGYLVPTLTLFVVTVRGRWAGGSALAPVPDGAPHAASDAASDGTRTSAARTTALLSAPSSGRMSPPT